MVHKHVSLWMGPLRGCVCFQQPSISLEIEAYWYKTDIDQELKIYWGVGNEEHSEQDRKGK